MVFLTPKSAYALPAGLLAVKWLNLLTALRASSAAACESVGTYLLWIELPGDVDTLVLNQRLEKHKIQIAPGVIFSASGKYRNCMRINFARPIPNKAMQLIGYEAKELLREQLVPR